MKTIILNETNVSLYLFADDKALAATDEHIVVGDPSAPDFIIGDLNSTNSTVVEGVTEPDDWYGTKYTYADGAWSAVPDWHDPRSETDPREEGGE